MEMYYPNELMVKVDLTYRKTDDWENGQIGKYVKTLKYSLGVHLLAWAWVLELQKRGTPHYHLIVVTDGKWPKIPDKSRQWTYGMSKIKKAMMPWYLMKYTGKEYQKDFSRYPRDARAYGMGFREKEVRENYRKLRDQKYYKKDDGHEWSWKGSALQKSYAEKVLMS